MWWNDSSIVITIHAVHHGLELRSERAFAIDTGINDTKLGIILILAIDRYYTSCSLVANSGGGILENSALHLYVSALFYSARFSFSRNQFELCDVGSVCDLVTSASSKNNLFNISTTCAYLAPAALSSCKQKIGQIHWTIASSADAHNDLRRDTERREEAHENRSWGLEFLWSHHNKKYKW